MLSTDTYYLLEPTLMHYSPYSLALWTFSDLVGPAQFSPNTLTISLQVPAIVHELETPIIFRSSQRLLELDYVYYISY
jgi:hypothetical protein